MVEGCDLLDGELPEDYKPIKEITVRRKGGMVDRTSDAYKEKLKRRMAEINRIKKIVRNRWKLTNLLLITQSASIIAIIALITAVMVLI